MKPMSIQLSEDNIIMEVMQPKDINSVYEIELLSFSSPWSKATFLSEIIENRFATYIVARLEGQIIGYGGMWLIIDEAHITTLAVLPAYRKRKLGGKILSALIDLAEQIGALRLTLEVRVSNLPARKLYEKYGFVVRGVRKKYYQDEDAYIMWKDDLL